MSAQTSTAAPTGMTNATMRTRAAIVGAAFELLPANPNASLNEIAEAAGVGRSTLHRHFSDRQDLILTLARHVKGLAVDAIARARPEKGSPGEALRRIVEELIDIGQALVWMHENVQVRHDPALHAEFSTGTEELIDLLERSVDPGNELSSLWRNRVFWEVLRLGSDFTDELPRGQVVEMILRTLRSGVVDRID